MSDEQKEMQPEYALGLNKKGFMYFVLLVIFFLPLAWVPWLSKELRGKPKEVKYNPDGTVKKSLAKKIVHMYAVLLAAGFCASLLVVITGKHESYRRISAAYREEADRKYQQRADFAAGYKAGYAFSNPIGKNLSASHVTSQNRMKGINRSMDSTDNAVKHLEFSYGGNKSPDWKEGCKEGYMDGIRNVSAKH